MLSIFPGERSPSRPGIDSRSAQIVASRRVAGGNACPLYVLQKQIITGIDTGFDPVAAFLPNPNVRGVPRWSGLQTTPVDV